MMHIANLLWIALEGGLLIAGGILLYVIGSDLIAELKFKWKNRHDVETPFRPGLFTLLLIIDLMIAALFLFFGWPILAAICVAIVIIALAYRLTR